MYEVVIQSGAILAVLVLYAKYILEHRDLIKQLLISFIPTAVIGFLLHGVIKSLFFNSTGLIAASLLIVGIVFLYLEYLVKKEKFTLRKDISQLSTKQALITGVAQSLAVIPGVSRAGIVIVALMGQGYKRSEAALYSFLLAIPTILAASALDLYKSRKVLESSHGSVPLLLVGFVTAFVTAYVSLRWFIAYLRAHSLQVFAYYRIVLAIIVMLFFFR